MRSAEERGLDHSSNLGVFRSAAHTLHKIDKLASRSDSSMRVLIVELVPLRFNASQMTCGFIYAAFEIGVL